MSPGVCSDSCPQSQWCYLTKPPIQPSSPFAFNRYQHQGLFQWGNSSHQVTKILELQLQHQIIQWILRIDFILDWLFWSPCCPRDSQQSSPAQQFEGSSSSPLSLLYRGLSHLYVITGKTVALTIGTFVSKGISLLFNTKPVNYISKIYSCWNILDITKVNMPLITAPNLGSLLCTCKNRIFYTL